MFKVNNKNTKTMSNDVILVFSFQSLQVDFSNLDDISRHDRMITYLQKQPPRRVLSKRYSENMQQIYRRTPMPKCDFNKIAKQIY